MGRGTVFRRMRRASGDGAVLGYALLAGPHSGVSGIVPSSGMASRSTGPGGQVVSMAVDGGRVAVLRRHRGRHDPDLGAGSPSRHPSGPARAIALHRARSPCSHNRGTLDVYSGRRPGRRSTRGGLPPECDRARRAVRDALVTAGRDVYAMNVATGRTARALPRPDEGRRTGRRRREPRSSSTRRGAGTSRFVPMSPDRGDALAEPFARR